MDNLLSGRGFTPAQPRGAKRIIIAGSGLQKSGKSNLGLTGPEPIAVHNFDIGLKGVVDKFLKKGKEIYVKEYPYSKPTRGAAVRISPQEQDVYSLVWEEFAADFEASIRMPKGTVVVDTWSEAFELLRLARLGKLASVLPRDYNKVYAEARELIRKAADSGVCVLLTQRMKPLWVDDKRTNNYEPSGFAETPFLVDCNVQLYTVPKSPTGVEFHMKILDCRDKMSLTGMDLVGDSINLEDLLELVYE